ncbi:MAG: preprotein translocase subunit YajC [Ruthenibacterium sp.]
MIMYFSLINAAAAGTSTGGGLAGTLSMLLPIGAMLVLMYFVMIRPQQKKDKQATQMRNSIEVGDGVTTIGGIIGRVASLKEDAFVLETGADRVKLRFKRWAIQEVEKLSLDAPAETKDAAEVKK